MSQLLRAGLVSEVVVALFLIFIAEADLVAQEIDLPWVRVEAGTFEMGCVPDDPFCLEVELPRHEVALSAFELMETELTVSQYGLFIEATGRTLPPTPDFSQTGDHPVVHLTWDDAASVCTWVGGRLQRQPDQGGAAAARADCDHAPAHEAAGHGGGRGVEVAPRARL